MRHYFQTDSIVAPMGSMLSRHVEKGYGSGPVAWHQDGSRLEQTRMLTCWMPLSECGENSPSLQIALGKLNHLYPEADLPQIVESRHDLSVWRPCYVPGDVMLFDPFTIHGTHFHDDMSEQRYSLEVRFCPQTHVLDQPNERIHRIYRFLTDDFVTVGCPEVPVWRQASP